MHTNYRVREGGTGILSLTSGGRQETYLPDCDMDAARELLLEFQELKDSDNRCLKDNYRAEGFDWYPTMVSQLYWYVFLSWVKYRPLAEDWLAGKKEFHFESKGNFGVLIGHLRGTSPRIWRQRLHDLAWRCANRLAVGRYPAELLFFRFAFCDFRSVEIRSAMDSQKIRYLQAVPAPSTMSILQSVFRADGLYFFPQPNKTVYGNRFRRSYNLSDLPTEKRSLFSAAINLLERTLTTCIREQRYHRTMLARSHIKAFYGFDDVNTYVFPLLYAARSLSMATIGHQHGAYVKRHAGYMLDGLTRGSVPWFDQVIVWGRYWREKMLRDAPVHPPERWVIGASKLKLSYAQNEGTPKSREHPNAVLVPYEFLADTATIGRYITRMIELGYAVWFRARTDEPLDAQLDAYQVAPDIRAKLQIAAGPLDENFLSRIDIVAGTMTTLIYELLPAGKIIWYLDTPYRHLYDLVEEGLAHHIRLDDLHQPGQMPPALMTPTLLPAAELFGSESIEEVLKRIVIPLLKG